MTRPTNRYLQVKYNTNRREWKWSSRPTDGEWDRSNRPIQHMCEWKLIANLCLTNLTKCLYRLANVTYLCRRRSNLRCGKSKTIAKQGLYSGILRTAEHWSCCLENLQELNHIRNRFPFFIATHFIKQSKACKAPLDKLLNNQQTIHHGQQT